MINNDDKITVIDFPQMISTEHENAKFYFDRDVQCIRKFFGKILKCDVSKYPRWGKFGPRLRTLDSEVKASGFSVEAEAQFQKMMKQQKDLFDEIENDIVTEDNKDDAVTEKDDDVVTEKEDDVVTEKDVEDVVTEKDEDVVTEKNEDDQEKDEDELDIPSIPSSELAVPSGQRNDDIIARVRAQRSKRKEKSRRRRTATRNKNKQRGKREIKKSAKASLRAAMDPW